MSSIDPVSRFSTQLGCDALTTYSVVAEGIHHMLLAEVSHDFDMIDVDPAYIGWSS
jgi:hypothetical protein